MLDRKMPAIPVTNFVGMILAGFRRNAIGSKESTLWSEGFVGSSRVLIGASSRFGLGKFGPSPDILTPKHPMEAE